MSKRMQVLLDPKEYKEFMRIARRENLSLGEWVRRSLRSAVNRVPGRQSAEDRIAWLNDFASRGYDAPAPGIDQMNQEILTGRSQGYLWDDEPSGPRSKKDSVR